MSLFIAMLIFLAMLFVQIKTYQRIKHGQTLTRVQTNVASSYILLSKRLGKTLYRTIGTTVLVLFAIMTLLAEAWIVTIVVALYGVYTTRTQKQIDNTNFNLVNGLMQPQQ